MKIMKGFQKQIKAFETLIDYEGYSILEIVIYNINIEYYKI